MDLNSNPLSISYKIQFLWSGIHFITINHDLSSISNKNHRIYTTSLGISSRHLTDFFFAAWHWAAHEQQKISYFVCCFSFNIQFIAHSSLLTIYIDLSMSNFYAVRQSTKMSMIESINRGKKRKWNCAAFSDEFFLSFIIDFSCLIWDMYARNMWGIFNDFYLIINGIV